MANNDFIFTDIINGHIAKSGKFYYYFDEKTGKILFKSKYKFEEIDGCYPKFTIGKNVYITDNEGVTLLKFDLHKFNSVIDECDTYKKEKEKINIKLQAKRENLAKKFADKGYDNVSEIQYPNNRYYIVKKGKFYGVLNENEEIVMDFKYPYISPTYFKQPHFIVQDPLSKKYGLTDINENPVIPFIYDNFHTWNIDEDEKTFVVVKDGKCGVIDINNKILVDFKFDYIYSYIKFLGNYTFACNENNLWGIMNRKGKIMKSDLSKVKEVNATTLNRKNAYRERVKAGYHISECLKRLHETQQKRISFIGGICMKHFNVTEDKNFYFDYGINIILGDNGSGKTSIVTTILNSLEGKSKDILYVCRDKTSKQNLDIINPNTIEELRQLMDKKEPFKENSVVIIDNIQSHFDEIEYDKFIDFLENNKGKCQFIITSTRSFCKSDIKKLNATIYVI